MVAFKHPLVRGLFVWLVIIVGEIIHGIARSVLLVPYLGDLRARQIGVLTGSLAILVIALALVRWMGAATKKQLAVVGVTWLILTLTFEMIFGRLALHYSWERLLADYNPAEGGLLGIGMIFLTLAPLLAAKIRGIELT
jgi:hypothetical protein